MHTKILFAYMEGMLGKSAFVQASTILLSALLTIASAADRRALVIGNNDYEVGDNLANPINDATEISKILGNHGYEVTTVSNMGFKEMIGALNKYYQDTSEADVSIVFYAGHGIEVEGHNYLIPVDAELMDPNLLDAECVPLTKVFGAMKHPKTKIKVLILDCCRDNPFGKNWVNRGLKVKGLADVPVSGLPQGTLLVYSGAPGRTVPDGFGNNSPFTTAFISSMKTDQSFLDTFVSAAEAMSNGRPPQEPWIKMDGALTSMRPFMSTSFLVGDFQPVSMIVSNEDSPSAERSFSNSPQVHEARPLVLKFYSNTYDERSVAYDEIVDDYFEDPEVLKELVQEGPKHFLESRGDHVVNSLTILNAFSPEAINAAKGELEIYLNQVQDLVDSNPDEWRQTSSLLRLIKGKLRSVTASLAEEE